jgi:hypothetical protein
MDRGMDDRERDNDVSATIIRGNALALSLADSSVDLIVTSPPYFSLRSYTDGGEHYAGQIGSEATPAEFVDALIAATREMVRVLKPSGSIWVNLGDSYAGSPKAEEQIGRGQRERRTRVEQFTREDAAWLAGVIDSDGSIGVHINKQADGRAPSFVPWVRIGQTRPEVVEHTADICGTGKVMQDGRGVWNWGASAQQARWVLERIHPWLLIKKRQAWAAIELARHVETRNAKGSWRQLTADDIAYRHRLRDAVMAWNQGESDDYQAPDPGQVSLPIYPLAPRAKSLRDIPHAYAEACVGRLGLIKRAEVCWSKPNGLPESVTDRVRRSHEFWFHFVTQPRYFSAVDEIREAILFPNKTRTAPKHEAAPFAPGQPAHTTLGSSKDNPLGKLPGSVWTIATQPLRVPPHLGIDHFAAFPMEFPRRIIQGWSPAGICTGCGEGRRPVLMPTGRVVASDGRDQYGAYAERQGRGEATGNASRQSGSGTAAMPRIERLVTGYACACPEPTAPTRPAIILDPFGGTGTTALMAKALGRIGISVDLSADYCRLAEWRTTDPGELARALRVEAPDPVPDGQMSLFGDAS